MASKLTVLMIVIEVDRLLAAHFKEYDPPPLAAAYRAGAIEDYVIIVRRHDPAVLGEFASCALGEAWTAMSMAEFSAKIAQPLVDAAVEKWKFSVYSHRPIVDDILQRRGQTHGDFSDNAQIALELRATMRAAPNYENLFPAQRLALEEIALKMARLLSEGAPIDFKETWDDIAGYATLGGNACGT